MNNEFSAVSADDFSKITIERLPHQDIENALITMGGGGVKGMTFKNDILKRAGWTGGPLTSFAKRPDVAAKAFNQVRAAFAKTDDPELMWGMFDSTE